MGWFFRVTVAYSPSLLDLGMGKPPVPDLPLSNPPIIYGKLVEMGEWGDTGVGSGVDGSKYDGKRGEKTPSRFQPYSVLGLLLGAL